jgi:isocitrate dehydrogenase (NAD+)
MKIVTINGDGIGTSIMDSTKKILKTLNPDFTFIDAPAGKSSLEKNGDLLPQNTLDLIRLHKYAIKSPLETPVGKGFSSVNVRLRKELDLFANIRPIKGNFNSSPIDFVIVRENTEGMYAGEQRSTPEYGEAISKITKKGAERIIRYSFEYAVKNKRKKVTLVHKANILKTTSGLMLSVFNEIKKEYPEIESQDLIVDNTCMQMVMRPYIFDVIVTSNLFGDILSDLGAGLIGGLGLAPGSNIGKEISVFEAVHGTAPDIEGKNIANPTALILSANLMLKELNMIAESDLLEKALLTINRKYLTKDQGGLSGTIEFTEALCSRIKKLQSDDV